MRCVALAELATLSLPESLLVLASIIIGLIVLGLCLLLIPRLFSKPRVPLAPSTPDVQRPHADTSFRPGRRFRQAMQTYLERPATLQGETLAQPSSMSAVQHSPDSRAGAPRVILPSASAHPSAHPGAATPVPQVTPAPSAALPEQHHTQAAKAPAHPLLTPPPAKAPARASAAPEVTTDQSTPPEQPGPLQEEPGASHVVSSILAAVEEQHPPEFATLPGAQRKYVVPSSLVDAALPSAPVTSRTLDASSPELPPNRAAEPPLAQETPAPKASSIPARIPDAPLVEEEAPAEPAEAPGPASKHPDALPDQFPMRIQAFGIGQIYAAREPLFQGRPSRELALALLLAHNAAGARGPVPYLSRLAIGDALWPQEPEEANQRANLSTCKSRLAGRLSKAPFSIVEDTWLDTRASDNALRLRSEVPTDLAAFTHLTRQLARGLQGVSAKGGPPVTGDQVQGWVAQLLRLYHGGEATREIAQGGFALQYPDEEWALSARKQYRRVYLDALGDAAQLLYAAAEHRAACDLMKEVVLEDEIKAERHLKLLLGWLEGEGHLEVVRWDQEYRRRFEHKVQMRLEVAREDLHRLLMRAVQHRG